MVQQFAHLLLHNLPIAQLVLRNLQIGTDLQFADLQFAQCDLQIAQIPRLCGTYIYSVYLFSVVLV